jgi:hypothetical protein
VWGLVKVLLSQDTLDKLHIWTREEAYVHLPQLLPREYVEVVINGDMAYERQVEEDLHRFLDSYCKRQSSWV